MATAFLDIDTQRDFMLPGGALYGPGSEKIIPVLARLNRYAMSQGMPLVSTACAHTEDDPEFKEWPPHCVIGTFGQKKPDALMVGQRVFEKQYTDMFRAPDADPLIASLGADEFVVYGVFTEVCVLNAVKGLATRGYKVAVVRDAVHHLDQAAATRFLETVRVISSSEVLAE